jgi:hypothetical protein
MQAGTVQSSGSGLNAGNVTVTFPTAFSAAPIVLANALYDSGTEGIVVSIVSLSATQAVIRWWDSTGLHSAVDLYWLAIGSE